MSDLVLHEFRDVEFNDPVAVIGFPGIGLVSSIATNYLSRELKMDLLAGFTSPSFPPYALLQGGRPMPQLRIFGGLRNPDAQNGDDVRDDIVVVTTEMSPKPEIHMEIAVAVLDWLQAHGIKKIITLDGIPMFKEDTYQILGAASNDETRELMKGFGIEPFDDGMVRGISGVMLMEGAIRGMDVISVLGSAKSELPDPKGAAMLMEPVKRMIPGLSLDTAPLYEEAEELDKKLPHSEPVQGEGINDIQYG